jgi:hypothetical protein
LLALSVFDKKIIVAVLGRRNPSMLAPHSLYIRARYPLKVIQRVYMVILFYVRDYQLL